MVLASLQLLVAGGRAEAARPVDPTGMRGLSAATQVLVVEASAMRATRATVTGWQRSDDGWRKAIPSVSGRIGRNGLPYPRVRHEGDDTTPIGNYGVVHGFGSQPNPAMTGFAWRSLTRRSCWSGTRADYNRWVERSPCGANDENLWAARRGAYRYAAVLDFNYSRPIFGRGSGIFLHVRGAGATAGCISLSERDLLVLLRWVRPGVRVMIGTTAWLRSIKAAGP